MCLFESNIQGISLYMIGALPLLVFVLRVSEVWSVRNMVCITSSASFLDRSSQVGSSMVSIIISLMNPSIDTYFSLIYNDIVSACTRGVAYSSYSYLDSKCLCWDRMSTAYHDVSIISSLPISISASLIFVSSSRAGIATNGIHSNRRYGFPMIAMHADAIFNFEWTCRYTAPRYDFLIKVHFGGHFSCMASVICITCRRHNPYKYGWRFSLIALLFTYIPDGSVKYQLWFTCIFLY